MGLQVGIVGAGIAGLGAAIALRRAGHTVEVFERSQFKNEIGAAIMVMPNGNRILDRWGLDFKKAGATKNNQFRSARSDTMEVVYQDDFAGVEEKYGNRYCAYHRVDLHAGLRELAEKQEGSAPAASIRLGSEVVNVDCEQGILTLADGRTIQKDFIVLADGCHCKFLNDVSGEATPVIKIGKSVYRWLTPMDRIREDPETQKIWCTKKPGFLSFFDEKTGVFVVTYMCRNEEMLNCAVFHNTREDQKDKEDWNSAATHEDVLGALQDFHPTVRSIPMKADQIKIYNVTQRPPSPRVTRGRVLALGDTVHHMLPSHGQGGNAALEDAAALEILLSPFNLTSLSDLGPLLQLYQQLRLPRSATTQILSATNPFLTMAALEKQTETIRKFYAGPLPPWPECPSWSEPLREFFYPYDIFEQAEKAVEAWKEEGRSEKGLKEPASVLKWFGDVEGAKWRLEDNAGIPKG